MIRLAQAAAVTRHRPILSLQHITVTDSDVQDKSENSKFSINRPIIMNFQLTQKHTTNTDLIGQDGQLWYRVETPWAMISKKTRVTRGGGVPGLIEWHTFGSANIQCNGRRIKTVSGGMFSQ